jgi:hypothetical protein
MAYRFRTADQLKIRDTVRTHGFGFGRDQESLEGEEIQRNLGEI